MLAERVAGLEELLRAGQRTNEFRRFDTRVLALTIIQAIDGVPALLAREPGPALEAIDRVAREGEDLGAFARDVIEVFRRVLVLKAAPSAQLADLAPVEANGLRKLGESATLDELLYALRALMEADALMRESPHPRVELEVAVVRVTRRPSPEAIEDVLRRVDDAQARLAQYVPAPPPAAAVQESFLSEKAAPAPARLAGRSQGEYEGARARPAKTLKKVDQQNNEKKCCQLSHCPCDAACWFGSSILSSLPKMARQAFLISPAIASIPTTMNFHSLASSPVFNATAAPPPTIRAVNPISATLSPFLKSL